jgi:membrane protein
MNPLDKGVRRVDGFQQSRPPFAFVFAVVKKFGDDHAGNLAALVAYYGFFSLQGTPVHVAAGSPEQEEA